MYRDRRILCTQCFDWGGFHITRDVAAGLQVSFEEADELVLEYGLSEALIQRELSPGKLGSAVPDDNTKVRSAQIKLKSAVHGASTVVDRDELEMIIFERSRELLNKVNQFINSRGISKHLVRGIILTGGAASIRNQVALAEAVFQVPARQGRPDGLDVSPQPVQHSAFTSVVGVARHGFARFSLCIADTAISACCTSFLFSTSINRTLTFLGHCRVCNLSTIGLKGP